MDVQLQFNQFLFCSSIGFVHWVLLTWIFTVQHFISDFVFIVLPCRYDPQTGKFTVPPGGAGLYYFSTYLLIGNGEYGRFIIRVNENILCTAIGDESSNAGNDVPQATCSALTQLEEGKFSSNSSSNQSKQQTKREETISQATN